MKCCQSRVFTLLVVCWMPLHEIASAFLTTERKAFFGPSRHHQHSSLGRKPTISASTTSLHMVLDFFRERSKEGIDQLGNLGDAFKKGELGKGLKDAASYTSETNKAFAVGLAKSRTRLLEQMETLLTGVSPEDMIEDLTDILLQADLGISTAEDIANEVQSLRLDSTQKLSKDDLKSIMRGKLIEALETPDQPSAIQFSTNEKIPTVLFIIGANGHGKTTTIGKLANRLKNEVNQTVLMAACDTFRAGAVDQLQQWADRAQVDMVSPTDSTTSPSAVLYSALDKAAKEGYDTLLVDTSGRLSNNYQLTQELAKMKRVIQKRLSLEKDESGSPILNPEVPHETLLVLDSAQGRMALDSAKIWNEDIGLTGLILTKLDGSARGGSVVAISKELQLPVKLIGVGEGINDLRDFDPESFVDGLLGIGKAGGGKAPANEGALLAERLEKMRKERDARAKERKNEPAVVATEPSAPNPYANSSGGNRPRGNPNRPKNKKKKKNKK